jgi:TolB protein
MAAAAVTLALLAPASAQAAFPGDNGILAWGQGPQGGDAIWGLDPGSSVPRTIIDLPNGKETDPSWSPDGQRIAFTHQPNGQSSGIWVANADGTGAMQISSGGGEPAWSPDGQRLAFVKTVGEPTLWVMNADGSGAHQVTSVDFGHVESPAWSPDGSKIAYQVFTPTENYVEYVTPDGTSKQFVALGSTPDWSPFGDELVVQRTDGLYIARLDGQVSGPIRMPPQNARVPAFSPDGTRIAFERLCCEGFFPQIFTIGYAGGVPQSANSPGRSWDPAWQPIPRPPAPRYVRPKAASPFVASLVPAFRQCEEPDRQHGPPLAFGSCSSPAQVSTTTTTGTPDANGEPAGFTGSVRLNAISDNPGTGPDEADATLRVALSDVRRADGSDYPFTLQTPVIGRVTERDVGSGQTLIDSRPETLFLYEWPLWANIPCTSTADPATGSTCATTTSLNALRPGSITGGRRAIWDLQQVRVFDAGPDGVADTQDDNEIFAVQGVFVP